MINRVVLVGRITKDVDLKQTSSNIYVTQFTLAVNRAFTNESGERQADFIQCVAWRNQAENMHKFVKKGNLLGIEGRISTRSYEDNDGRTVYVTEVVCDSVQFLESKNSQSQDNPEPSPYDHMKSDKTDANVNTVKDDDLPF